MVKQDQAESLATKAMQQYVADCSCDNMDDLGNALLKLLSVVSHAIAITHGKETALDMLQGTYNHVARRSQGKGKKATQH